MKKNFRQKRYFILFGIFFISLFLGTFAFADNSKMNFIEIQEFYYNEAEELVMTWTVSSSFKEDLDNLLLTFPEYENFETTGAFIKTLSNINDSSSLSRIEFIVNNDISFWPAFSSDYLNNNCIYTQDNSGGYDPFDVVGLKYFDFGNVSCTMKFSSFIKRSNYPIIYPKNGIFITKSDIDDFYYSDFLEDAEITIDQNRFMTTASAKNSYNDTRFFFSNSLPILEPYFDNVLLGNFPFTNGSTPVPINGECGTANGSTFDWDDFDNQDFCSAGDFYLAGDNGERIIYACEGLNGGTTQYNCFADYYYDLDPTITDVIDFDFEDFEYDFEEGDVSKNWIIDIFKFLFLPREQTLEKFFITFDNFKQKIPFGYIYLIQNKFKEVSLESTDEFALDLNLLGEEYEVFSVASLKEQIGENTFNIFYNTMKYLIWIIFALYLITKVQKLFNND